MCGGAAFVDCAADGGTAPTHRVAAAAEGHAESAEGHATNVIHNVTHQFPAPFQARRQASTQEEAERAGAAHDVEAEFPEEASAFLHKLATLEPVTFTPQGRVSI